MTEYHHAPYTLDPTKELPEDVEEVAPAAGYDEEMTERVRELHGEHKAAVEEAEQAAAERNPEDEPPYAPGEFQGPGSGEDPEVEPREGDGPPNGTVQEVLDWVGDDPARAQEALDAERAGQNRSTLIAELEARAG
jgi:hypothetical protein